MKSFKNVILHIGFPKTATTFFQNVVFPYLKTFYYLDPNFIIYNNAFNDLILADDIAYDENDVLKTLNEINSDNLLISCEELVGTLCQSLINRTIIANRLQRLFPNAKIILFLRGQQDIILSFYNQYIKNCSTGYLGINEIYWKPQVEFDLTINAYEKSKIYHEFLKEYHTVDPFKVHLDCFKYHEIVSLYAGLFPKTHIFLYEDFVSNPIDILRKIEVIFDEKILDKNKMANNYLNKGISNKQLGKKRFSNKLRIFIKKEWVIKIITKLFFYSNFEYENDYVRKLILNYYQSNNQKLLKDYPEIGIDKYSDKYEL